MVFQYKFMFGLGLMLALAAGGAYGYNIMNNGIDTQIQYTPVDENIMQIETSETIRAVNGMGTMSPPETTGVNRGPPEFDRGTAYSDTMGTGLLLDPYNYPVQEIDETELQDLYYMWQEEKVARDVYTTLYETYGLPIFTNIAKSEQIHMETIESIMEKYDLTIPIDEGTGIFPTEEFTELYQTLVEQGQQSMIDALNIGETIEKLDIQDLQEKIENTDNLDIQQAYSNLMRGSENHLTAFGIVLENYQ